MIYKPSLGEILSVNYRQHPRYQGCVGHWMMVEGGGAALYDFSGYQKRGTFGATTAAPAWVTGQFGPALDFDGTADYVSCPLNLSGGIISLSFWLNWTTYANNDDAAMELGANTKFAVHPNSSIAGGGFFRVYLEQTAVGASGKLITRPAAGVWHHYGIAINTANAGGSEVEAIYVDGVAVSLMASGTTDISGNFSNDLLYLMSRTGSVLFGQGKLDDVRVYSRILTAQEFVSLYQNPFLEFEEDDDDLTAFSGDGAQLFTQPVADTVAFTETFTQQAQKTIAETLSLTEDQTIQVGRTITETLGLTENLATAVVKLKDLADTVTLTESLQMQTNKTSAETLSLVEGLIKEAGKINLETLGLSEDLTTQILKLQSVSDTVSLNESLVKSIIRAMSETVGLTESDQALVTHALAESLGLTEDLTTQILKLQSVADTVSLSESLIKTVVRAISETVSLTESDEVLITRGLAESLGLTENLSTRILKAIGEAIQFTEQLATLTIASAETVPVDFQELSYLYETEELEPLYQFTELGPRYEFTEVR